MKHNILARVERTITDDVILHLIKEDTPVEIQDGAEYLVIETRIDPWTPPDIS